MKTLPHQKRMTLFLNSKYLKYHDDYRVIKGQDKFNEYDNVGNVVAKDRA